MPHLVKGCAGITLLGRPKWNYPMNTKLTGTASPPEVPVVYHYRHRGTARSTAWDKKTGKARCSSLYLRLRRASSRDGRSRMGHGRHAQRESRLEGMLPPTGLGSTETLGCERTKKVLSLDQGKISCHQQKNGAPSRSIGSVLECPSGKQTLPSSVVLAPCRWSHNDA